MFRALSWGMGVQSTALAVMSALGDLDPLDIVISADTQDERRKTYEVAAYYREWLEARGVRVEIVTVGNIADLGATEHIHIPFWTDTGAPLRRQCTSNFKIYPTRRRIRELMGYDASKAPSPPPGSVEQWIGFSWDEVGRIKDSDVQFIVNRYPLVERRMTRNDCEDYLKSLGLPVPIKSACKRCPYRAASEWIDMRDNDPDEWGEIIRFDDANRDNPLAKRGGSTADQLFIYKRGVPLASANLEADAKRERKGRQLPLFLCDGPCMT